MGFFINLIIQTVSYNFQKYTHRIAMKNKGKENYQHANLASDNGLMLGNYQRISQIPLSPIKKHSEGDSFTTNIFEHYPKSTSEISYPLSNLNRNYQQSQALVDRERNMDKIETQSPESESFWKNKFLESQKNCQSLSRKCENRTKQMCKMQQTIENQANTMRQMDEQINRLNGILARSQRNQGWNSTFSSQSDSSKNGINRFYVQELERAIDNLQRENQRLSSIIMRKVKNCFE